MEHLNNRPLIIDTCAIIDKDFLKWLKGYHGEKRISSVTYMEYSLFYYEKKGWELERVDRILNGAGIDVEPFSKKQAGYAVELMAGRTSDRRCGECGKLDWNDCMIASHAPIAPTILVTKNVRDFPSTGAAVMTPEDVMRCG
jgi:predicted nucleic acid-binding protein